MTKLRKQVLLDKKALASDLLAFAKDVLRGELSFEQQNIKLPEEFEVKYKYKIKDGFSKYKISFKWPDKPDKEHQVYLPENVKQLSSKTSFEDVKKILQSSLAHFGEMGKSGRLPSVQEAEDFINTVDASLSRSKKKLSDGMKEVRSLSLELKNAVELNDIGKFQEALKLLYQLKEKYQQLYK